MEQFITKEQIKDYLTLPSTFDWDLVDQELGFKKIFAIFPEEKYLEIAASHSEIFRLLTKAAIHYAFVFSIPKIKVHINNYGIQEFTPDKMKSSSWWDIRDLGISLLKIADSCFSEAISLAYGVISLDFFLCAKVLETPAEFEKIYSINHSIDTFLLLQPLIKRSLEIDIYPVLKNCYNLIGQDDKMNQFLKQAVAYYSLYYASILPNLTFTQNAVVVQYEELPWQKSQVLDSHSKMLTGQNFKKMADDTLKIITDHIKSHIEDFPCFSGPVPDRKMQARDSGIYLT